MEPIFQLTTIIIATRYCFSTSRYQSVMQCYALWLMLVDGGDPYLDVSNLGRISHLHAFFPTRYSLDSPLDRQHGSGGSKWGRQPGPNFL